MKYLLISLAVFIALALATTWPVVQHPTSRLPLGTESAKTVPMFNAWTIWWNADRLLHAGRGYWDAPIFYPTRDSFAFSEPQPTTVLVAPVLWASGSRVLAYNVYLWLSLLLNGLFAERLLRLVGTRRSVALGGGAAMTLLPLVHWQMGVLQLVPVWGILWTWTAFLKIARLPADRPSRRDASVAAEPSGSEATEPSRAAAESSRSCCAAAAWWRRHQALRHGVELGVAFAVACLTCVHHGLFLAVLMAGAGVTLGPRLMHLRTWGALGVGLLVAGLLTAPVVIKLHQVMRAHAFTRPVGTVASLSAMPGDYLAPAANAMVDWGAELGRPGWLLSPGLGIISLAVIGLVFGMLERRLRIWTAFLAVTAGLAFALSLGTYLRLGSWQPWLTLAEYGPGLSQVRNVFRFAYFVQMATVLCAAQGVEGLARVLGGRNWTWPWRYGGGALLAGLALFAVADTWPKAPSVTVAPDVEPHREWIELIAERAAPGRGIACLPFAKANHVLDFEITTRWMFLGTYHGVAMVNGYSGFFPDSYFKTRSAIANEGLSDNVLRQLAADGVAFIVVDRALFPSENVHPPGRREMVLEHVGSAAAGVDVYHVVRASE